MAQTFWEVYQPFDGPGLYLRAEDKLKMVENGLPFSVTSISEGDGAYGPEFNVTIEMPDPATDGGKIAKALSLKIGYVGRDRKLRAMREWLESNFPEAVVCKLVTKGRMYDLADGLDALDQGAWVDWSADEVTA